ncbi:MoaD/ThiS family protein [Petrachloros mirabilis]
MEVKGPKRAKDVLRELSLVVEAHLVIRGDELVTEDEMLSDKDQIEIRPVISGGSVEPQARDPRHPAKGHERSLPASCP